MTNRAIFITCSLFKFFVNNSIYEDEDILDEIKPANRNRPKIIGSYISWCVFIYDERT